MHNHTMSSDADCKDAREPPNEKKGVGGCGVSLKNQISDLPVLTTLGADVSRIKTGPYRNRKF